MNEHELADDPAFDRLRAADPARRAPEPADGVLRAKLDQLLAGSGHRPEPDEADHQERDELAVRRHRRRTPWLVAAAVAGIVAAGGGGYLAGEGSSETAMSDTALGSSADEQAPQTLAAPEQEGRDGVEQLDVGGALPSAPSLVFHAGVGLSAVPGTAEVFAADGPDRESLGSYPVISEVAAVERLGDPRFAGAVLGARHAGTPHGSSSDQSSKKVPVPGDPIVWPVGDVTIAEATLTEARYTLPGGGSLVVPAYELADASGKSWTVMAVDEDLLDFTP